MLLSSQGNRKSIVWSISDVWIFSYIQKRKRSFKVTYLGLWEPRISKVSDFSQNVHLAKLCTQSNILQRVRCTVAMVTGQSKHCVHAPMVSMTCWLYFAWYHSNDWCEVIYTLTLCTKFCERNILRPFLSKIWHFWYSWLS